jgi:CubicO group peptidase (beta-lactamase class C family)
MLKFLFGLLAGFLLAGAAMAQPAAPSDQELAGVIDGYVASGVRDGGIPGAAIVVVRDGHVILSKGYGYADLQKRTPVVPDKTLFRQASVSKTFIWVLAMQLVEEGRLDLDRDVNAYLDFKIPPAFGKPITMRHLMTHRAGFAERYWGAYDPAGDTPLGQRMRENIPARVYAPGEVFGYSNYGAMLAAYIVERLRGQPIATLVKDRIYKPAGMTASSFQPPFPPPLLARLATGYHQGERTAWPVQDFPIAGAMIATEADVARYALMLLAGGSGPGGTVLKPETLAAMFTPQPSGSGTLPDVMGLGFFVARHHGVTSAGHGGNLTAYAADFVLFPDSRLGYAIGFNSEGNGGDGANLFREALARAVADQLAAAPTAPRAFGPSTAADLAGRYVTTRRGRSGPVQMGEILGQVSVVALLDGTLTVSSEHSPDGMLTRWLPQGRDRFLNEGTGVALGVARDADGRIRHLGFSDYGALDPAPTTAVVAAPMAGSALALLAFAALAGPAGWALRRGLRAPLRPAPSRAAQWSTPAARLALWFILGAVGAVLAFLQHSEYDSGLMLFGDAKVRNGTALLAALTVPAAIVMVADAIIAWRDPARGLPRRIGGIFVALAAVALAWLFYHFGIASFSTNY